MVVCRRVSRHRPDPSRSRLLAGRVSKGQALVRSTLRPGALFIVGDPKQSIYRFRRADIDTYQLVRWRIHETGGQILSLSTSFLSTPSLCSWVNQVFPSFFPVEVTPAQPAFQPLDPKPGSASNALSLSHLTTPAAFEKAREVATGGPGDRAIHLERGSSPAEDSGKSFSS